MRLMVTDTGIGIAPEDIDSIFDEFHQVKTNSFTEGLGLGLSIVQRTAELLNCRVGVQSELGHGSSFYIDVPLGSMEKVTEHEDTAMSSRLEGSGHVLIVDDEPDIIEATTMPVSYTHLRAHETRGNLVCRLLLEKKKKKKT